MNQWIIQMVIKGEWVTQFKQLSWAQAVDTYYSLKERYKNTRYSDVRYRIKQVEDK